MLVYNINLIIVYVSALISRLFKVNIYTKLVSYFFIIISFCSIFIISGYRYYVGTDYSTYQNIFNTIKTTNKDDSITEIGYYILNKIIYGINQNPQMIFIVTSSIILGLIFFTIIKQCSRYELALYLFITMFHFYASLNVIRQYIAIAITFFAVKYIFEKNFFRYLILVLLASTFHITSIIMIPIYFIVIRKMDIREYIYGAIIGLILLVGFEKLLILATDIFPRYEGYTESVLFTYGSTSGVIIYGVIFLCILIYKDRLIELDNRNSVYINFIFLSVLVGILTTKGVLFARIAGFFNIYAILIIPNILDLFNKKEKRLIYYSILCIGYLYCYLMLRTNQAGVLPFRFAPM